MANDDLVTDGGVNPSMPPGLPQTKSKASLIIIVIIFVIIAAAVAGVGVYMWQQSVIANTEIVLQEEQSNHAQTQDELVNAQSSITELNNEIDEMIERQGRTHLVYTILKSDFINDFYDAELTYIAMLASDEKICNDIESTSSKALCKAVMNGDCSGYDDTNKGICARLHLISERNVSNDDIQEFCNTPEYIASDLDHVQCIQYFVNATADTSLCDTICTNPIDNTNCGNAQCRDNGVALLCRDLYRKDCQFGRQTDGANNLSEEVDALPDYISDYDSTKSVSVETINDAIAQYGIKPVSTETFIRKQLRFLTAEPLTSMTGRLMNGACKNIGYDLNDVAGGYVTFNSYAIDNIVELSALDGYPLALWVVGQNDRIVCMYATEQNEDDPFSASIIALDDDQIK
jgi:hypothetical protein